MFCGLAALLKASFEFTLPSRYDKCTNISLGSTLYHIRNIILMTRSIQYSEPLCLGLEESLPNFNRLSLCSLFRIQVHDIRNPPTFSFLRLSILLELLQLNLVNSITRNKNSTTSCRLPRVNMSNKNNVNRFSGRINLNEFVGIEVELLIYYVVI